MHNKHKRSTNNKRNQVPLLTILMSLCTAGVLRHESILRLLLLFPLLLLPLVHPLFLTSSFPY
jgi:hypothetical protein